MPPVAERLFATENATAAFARSLGAGLQPGDVVLLKGNLGAGKTAFARALIQSRLLEMEDVPSPTFTLVQIYDAGTAEIWHADLYRLANIDDCVELGLLEAFDTAICLVEWPEQLGDDAPVDALTLELSMTGTPGERRALLSYTDPKWAERLQIASAHD